MSYGHWMCKIYHITTRCPPKTVRKKQHPGRICIMGLQDFWCIPACCFHRMFWHHPSVQIEISKRKKNTMIAFQRKIRTCVQKGQDKISQLHTSSGVQLYENVFLLFLPVYALKSFQSVPWHWPPHKEISEVNRFAVECRVCSWDWVSVQEHAKNNVTFLLEKSCPFVGMIKDLIKVWESYRTEEEVLSVNAKCNELKDCYW